jgi:hypothetical protein
MNRDEIIEMANRAGIVNPQMVINTLEAFANLVAQHEREACARVCDEFLPLGNKCAYAIRARDKQDGECKHCTDGCPACDARKLPEQEPVAWRYRWSVEGGNWVWNYATYIERQKDDRCEPLYTAPPQRTWVGLTDKDWNRSKHNYDFQKGVDWAESILKEKNA